jgi:sterol desaturase/sphingolipid hydroxylase (fatty acid hydroxylase superfamily)
VPLSSLSETLLVELAKLQVQDFDRLQFMATGTFFSLCIVEGLLTRPRLSPRPTPDLVADMFYWLTIPTVRIISRFVIGALLVLIALPLGLTIGPTLFDGFGPLARQPKWLIAVEGLMLMDLSAYWGHRLFHTLPGLWRFHAIHHSAVNIRWSTTGRIHPVNEIANYAVTVVPCFVIGLPLSVVLPLVPVMVIYAVSAHAQWNPSFGPLRAVFASPRFHRWHHTHSSEGGNKNFANLFSFWDRVFGTYYLPEGKVAEKFGLDEGGIPEDYVSQLLYPFRKPGGDAGESESSAVSDDHAASRARAASR